MTQTISRRAMLKGTLAAPFFLYACGGNSGSSPIFQSGDSVTAQWMSVLLAAIVVARPGPPITARAIGMVATAGYDAWAAYDAKALGSRLGSQLRRPIGERTLGNKKEAISYAMYRTLVDLFPSQVATFDAKMAALGYDPSFTSTDPSRAAGVGNRAAEALLQFRHDDGSNQLAGYADTTGYVPVNTPDSVVDPSQWQQLRFANGAAPGFVAPHWGQVVPFALTSPSAIRPSGPPAFGSPTYRDQVREIVELTANLNDERKTIAEFWADGPGTVQPPGHWQQFGLYVSKRDGHDLDRDVKMFFYLANAVMDAGIACWDCKRFFNTSRPFTAIRYQYAGQEIPSFEGPDVGIKMVDGSQWHPYQSVNFVTPPFPDYTSGHSTFSAAAAEVLKRFTGSDDFGASITVAAGSSTFEKGLPHTPVSLAWSTFTAAADQAGISRRYGGIHFEAADIEGRMCGRKVGEIVWEKATSLIEGTAPSRDV